MAHGRTTATTRGTRPVRRASTKPTRPGMRGQPARWPLVAGLATAVVALTVVVVIALSQRGPDTPGSTVDFGHVHGLAVDRGTGALYAATHVGLFRIDGEHAAVRLSQQALDLMGFTTVGPGRFLASGHPDQRGAGPANLGLIESTDGGATWRSMSLSGAADFHGLQAAHGMVYGYNSTDGAFMVSTDRRSWERRSTVPIVAFVVSPTDPQTVLASGPGGLQRSVDGGRTWSPMAGAPAPAMLAWPQATQVWGAGRDGTVWSSTDAGGTWQRRGQLPAQPHALTVHESTVVAAVTGDVIVASTDGGATWTRRYAPR